MIHYSFNSFQANGMFEDYVTSLIENSNKFVILFKILEETIKCSERILLFSQSLLTLDLIEDFLQQRTMPGKLKFSRRHAQVGSAKSCKNLNHSNHHIKPLSKDFDQFDDIA